MDTSWTYMLLSRWLNANEGNEIAKGHGQADAALAVWAKCSCRTAQIMCRLVRPAGWGKVHLCWDDASADSKAASSLLSLPPRMARISPAAAVTTCACDGSAQRILHRASYS